MPTNVMDHAQFPTFLDARYTGIIQEELEALEDVRPLIYDMMTTDRLEERYTSSGGLGEWSEFTGEIDFQSIHEQHQTIFRPREYAAATQVTRRMVRDDLSGVLAGARFRPMVRGAILTEQLHATRLFDMMDVVDSHWSIRTEGVPIASAVHTTRTPGVSTATGFNNVILAPLSEVSLRVAQIQGRKLRSSEGNRMNLTYDTLVVPVDLVPLAHEILRTSQGLNTPGLNENQESSNRSGIRNIVALPHMQSSSRWFLCNKRMMKDMVKWVTSESPTYGRMTEFHTMQVKSRGYMRHGVMVLGWRWVIAGLPVN